MATQAFARENTSAMPERISFMSADYVARELDYRMTIDERAPRASLEGGWTQSDRAISARFAPLETFGQRFGKILAHASDMGFQAIDLWAAHLNWRWATPEHVATARDLLRWYDLSVSSLVMGSVETRQEFEAACRLARSLDARMLQGGMPLVLHDRDFVVTTLERYGLKLGLHNASERSMQEILAKSGNGNGNGNGSVIGVVVDTGFCGSNGYDATKAIEELGKHVIHVHLRDVQAPGAHGSCRYGQGCVPVERCVRALMDMEYQGYYCIEHEIMDFDSRDDCRANLAMLRQWLERDRPTKLAA